MRRVFLTSSIVGALAEKCRYPNSEIAWTGKETHDFEDTWQTCRTKCVEAEGCCGWVFLGNNDCYQKYDTGSGCPLQIGVPDVNYGSSAGQVDKEDYHANSEIAWTGRETHATEDTWQTCRTKCAQAEDCCGWVFLGNNDCYQKYDTGYGCPLKIGVPDVNYGSSAGQVGKADFHADSNIAWTGKETHDFEDTWQTCRTKCVEAEGCCGWVFLGNNDCYQKYDTGSGCPLKIGAPDGNYGSSAGQVDQQCDTSTDAEYLAQSETAWLLPAIGGFGAGVAIVGGLMWKRKVSTLEEPMMA